MSWSSGPRRNSERHWGQVHLARYRRRTNTTRKDHTGGLPKPLPTSPPSSPCGRWRRHGESDRRIPVGGLCAAGIRQRADEMVVAAKLPPGMTLAQWFAENEVLLQQDPNAERTRVVAAALLPLFERTPDCWDAMNWLDDDMTQDTFAGLLRDWHARVPEKHRPFVRRIATGVRDRDLRG